MSRPSGVEIDPAAESGKVLPINNFKAKQKMGGLYLNTTHSSIGSEEAIGELPDREDVVSPLERHQNKGGI